MKVSILCVGKANSAFADAIAEYERRCNRYWQVSFVEVKEEKGKQSPEQVRTAESQRLRDRIPDGAVTFALTRDGQEFNSTRFARMLEQLSSARGGVVFVIGGAFGLSDEFIDSADHKLSLSALTLPHDIARLVLIEQLYRAATILRGEPYHKAAE